MSENSTNESQTPLPIELVEAINNLKDFDDFARLDIYSALSEIFSLIPVRTYSTKTKVAKAPIKRGWTEACYTKKEFEAFDYISNNAGIACGLASGIIVLDVDNIKLFDQYIRNNHIDDSYSNTFTVKTGSGKPHYYFKYPKDQFTYGRFQEWGEINVCSGIKEQVVAFDVLGCRSQVVAPGSIHPVTMQFYTIQDNLPIADAPEWVLDLCRKESFAESNARPNNSKGIEPDEVNYNIKPIYNDYESHDFDEDDGYEDYSPQRRFKDHFDDIVWWGFGKEIERATYPNEAFKNSNYLMFPKSRRSYMCFDLDYTDSASAWKACKLPEPTITIVNTHNGRSHIAYELTTPVYWPCEYNKTAILKKPVAYFKAIRFAYDQQLNADRSYNHSSIKNPFSNSWATTWVDKAYSLKELASFVNLPSIKEYFEATKSSIYAGRDPELFNIARKWGFLNVKKHFNIISFQQDMYSYLNKYNSDTIPLHWPDKGPMQDYVIHEKTKFVSEWIWPKRDDKRYGKVIKNFGVMGLQPIQKDISDDERSKLQKENKALGTKHTHKTKMFNNDSLILNAVDELMGKGMIVSNRNLVKITGLSKNTIRLRNDMIDSYYKSKEFKLGITK